MFKSVGDLQRFNSYDSVLLLIDQGGSRIFMRGGGGGGGSRLCAHNAHNKREIPYGWESGQGSSRVLDAPSCYVSLILKHSDTKRDTKKLLVDHNVGDGCLLHPRLDPPL